MARPGGLGRQPLLALDTLLPVGVRLDQAGIDRKAFAADQTLPDAAPQHRLEQAPQQIALAETAMPVLREGRMIGHIAIEPKPTKPAISQIEVDLLAQPPLGANAEAIATSASGSSAQDRSMAVPASCRMVPARAVDLPTQQSGRWTSADDRWNMPFERELVKQRSLFDLPMSHHDSALSQRLISETHPPQLQSFSTQSGQERTSGQPRAGLTVQALTRSDVGSRRTFLSSSRSSRRCLTTSPMLIMPASFPIMHNRHGAQAVLGHQLHHVRDTFGRGYVDYAMSHDFAHRHRWGSLAVARNRVNDFTF